MHIAKATEENLQMTEKEVLVDEYDDHGLHVIEHTRFLLSAEGKVALEKGGADVKKRFVAHINEHKNFKDKE